VSGYLDWLVLRHLLQENRCATATAGSWLNERLILVGTNLDSSATYSNQKARGHDDVVAGPLRRVSNQPTIDHESISTGFDGLLFAASTLTGTPRYFFEARIQGGEVKDVVAVAL
jgi:hypothetical protein